MDFRITETSKGFIVENKIVKWSLFGLKTKWIPFVKSTGLECAWHHKTYDYAMINLLQQIKKDMRFFKVEGWCRYNDEKDFETLYIYCENAGSAVDSFKVKYRNVFYKIEVEEIL